MASDSKPNHFGKEMKRTLPFIDDAGFKDAQGLSINMGLMPRNKENQVYPPFGQDHLESVKTTKIRHDDFIVCGYPKTGCHWVWETMSMILKGKGEHSSFGKMQGFLEMVSPDVPASLPSPRILNSHYRYNELPEEALRKKTKLVFTTRNPKDTAVSFYNHHIKLKDIYGYNGKFNDWFPLYIEGKVDYGDFFSYHASWHKALRENPDHPVLSIRYEDMKEDYPAIIRQLAKFMEVELTEDQVQHIAHAGHINTMKTAFQAKGSPSADLIRKGAVGDWKNHLTVAQNEMIDAKCEEFFLDETVFSPRYHL